MTHLKNRLKFSLLVLGVGSQFGKNRQGNETQVKKLSEKLHFETEYLPKLQLGTAPVSSGRIRSAIALGNLEEASLCLGRRYSLFGKLLPQKDHYLLSLGGICLPPNGTYPIHLKTSDTVEVNRAHINRAEGSIRIDLATPPLALAAQDAELIF